MTAHHFSFWSPALAALDWSHHLHASGPKLMGLARSLSGLKLSSDQGDAYLLNSAGLCLVVRSLPVYAAPRQWLPGRRPARRAT